jgi:hypothetical protein
MDSIPRTNVVATFENLVAAKAAVAGLRACGFAEERIGVMDQGERKVVTVEADARHGEVAACLENADATGVQNVAR